MNTDDIPLIAHPDDATPEWLTSALRAAGVVGDATITEVDAQAVGTGQVGDSIRFALTYDRDEGGPATVVGKFPTEDETSRATGTATRTYEVEANFYRHLHPLVDITTPIPYLVKFDPETHDFVLLMNDLAPAEQGDQILGCTPDQAALAMDQAARLHAPVWGDPRLKKWDWCNRGTEEGIAGYAMMLQMLYPSFLERYDGRVEPEVVEAGQDLVDRVAAYLAYRPEPWTAVHTDFRLDNMLFGTAEGGAPLTVVDWQTVQCGTGLADLAYFNGTGLLPELRAHVEEDLLKEYLSTLRGGGVTSLAYDEAWHRYRHSAFAGFIMAVLSSMIVGQTNRGDEMFMAMANRSARMAIDLDTLSMF